MAPATEAVMAVGPAVVMAGARMAAGAEGVTGMADVETAAAAAAAA